MKPERNPQTPIAGHRSAPTRRRLVGRSLAPALRPPHLCPPVIALLLLTGCSALPTGLANRPVGTYDRPYPRELIQDETLDIQVIREPETIITMTNTTSQRFGPSTVWVNARFSRPIDGLDPGETVRMDLYDFRDEFGEAFRAGGFFATKQPERLIQAQLETLVDGESRMIGLVVVGQDV